MADGFGDDLLRERIISLGIAQYDGSQARILGCGCPFGPRDQAGRVRSQPSHHFAQERSPCRPAIVGPKREPHRLEPEFGAAALIRDRKAVASDTELATLHPGETDAAGAENHDGSILATMRPQTSIICIARVNGP